MVWLGPLLALFLLSPLLLLGWRGLERISVWATSWDLALVSLGLGLAGAVLCLMVGGGLAWLAFRARLSPWWDLLLLPAYLVPPFVAAVGFLYAAEPVGIRLYGVGGILLAWTAHYAPLAYLLIRPALEGRLAPLLIAAQVHGVSGAGRIRALLPPLLPVILGAFGAVLLALLGNFGVPAVLGIPAGIYTLPTLAYSRLSSPASADPLGEAAAIGLLLGVLALPIIALAGQSSGEPAPRVLRAVGGGWARGSMLFFAAVAVGLPLFGLLRKALLNPYTGAIQPAFADAWALPLVQQGFVNSAVLALVATVLLLGLAMLLAPAPLLLVRLRKVLDLNYLIPGTLLALGLILLLAPTWLYSTPYLLLIAYLLNFAALALRSLEAGLQGGISRLVEVGRLFGLSRWRAWQKVGYPLLRPYAAAGAFLIFPLCLAELTLSALLYAPGSETIGVAVLSALNGGLFREAAAIGLGLMIFSLLLLALPRRVS